MGVFSGRHIARVTVSARLWIPLLAVTVFGLVCAGAHLYLYPKQGEGVPPRPAELVVRQQPLAFVVGQNVPKQGESAERVVAALERLLPRPKPSQWNLFLHQLHLWGARRRKC